jgi:acetyl esterase/lipase
MDGVSNPRDVLDRTAPPPDAAVRYGRLPEHVADVRWPTQRSADAAPLVVVVHGGFWRAEFDRTHTGPQCAGLADDGYAVAAIEYRRTGMPGGGFPGTLEDVATALQLVPGLVAAAAEVAGVAVDTARTVALGHSAGGHLVAWAATQATTAATAAISLGGVLDLAQAAALGLDPGEGGSAVEALLGGQPADVPELYAACDPAALGRPLIPVTAVHGADDDVVPPALSLSYADRTSQEVVVLPGIEHFGLIDPQSPAWPVVLQHLAHATGRTAR